MSKSEITEKCKNDMKERRERAKTIVDELAGEGRTYSNALSVLKIAIDELGNKECKNMECHNDTMP